MSAWGDAADMMHDKYRARIAELEAEVTRLRELEDVARVALGAVSLHRKMSDWRIEMALALEHLDAAREAKEAT